MEFVHDPLQSMNVAQGSMNFSLMAQQTLSVQNDFLSVLTFLKRCLTTEWTSVIIMEREDFSKRKVGGSSFCCAGLL